MPEKQNNLWSLLGVAAQLGYLIAIPLVVFALLGRMIDRLLQTSPLFFLAGVLVAIVLSTVIVSRKVSQLMADAEAVSTKKDSMM